VAAGVELPALEHGPHGGSRGALLEHLDELMPAGAGEGLALLALVALRAALGGVVLLGLDPVTYRRVVPLQARLRRAVALAERRARWPTMRPRALLHVGVGPEAVQPGHRPPADRATTCVVSE